MIFWDFLISLQTENYYLKKEIMNTKYTFSLKDKSETEKKLEGLNYFLSREKAKSRLRAVQSTPEDNFEFVSDDAPVKNDENSPSCKKLRIRAIKNSSYSPLQKLSNLVKATTSDRMEYLKKWPSFSSKLQEDFHLDDDTNLFYVNRILNMAEKDVDNGIERTVEQWYDYIVFCFNAMQVEPKWNANYAEALANAVEQRKEYERSILEGTYKQRDRGLEISLLQRDKSDLKHTITQLQHDKEQLEKEISQLRSQLEANSKILSEAKNSLAANRTPIADEPLTVLADGVKEYVDEVGVDKAYDLFNRLNTILIDVPAWTKHASALKKVFKKARQEMQNRSMVQGDLVVNKHVDKEVNGVSAGATGILINNNED